MRPTASDYHEKSLALVLAKCRFGSRIGKTEFLSKIGLICTYFFV